MVVWHDALDRISITEKSNSWCCWKIIIFLWQLFDCKSKAFLIGKRYEIINACVVQSIFFWGGGFPQLFTRKFSFIALKGFVGLIELTVTAFTLKNSSEWYLRLKRRPTKIFKEQFMPFDNTGYFLAVSRIQNNKNSYPENRMESKKFLNFTNNLSS